MQDFNKVFEYLSNSEAIWISHKLIYDATGNVIGRYDQQDYPDSKFILLIAIYPEFRRMGYFSQMLRLLCKAADMTDTTLQLIPLPTETDEIPASGMSLSKLRDVYESYGFVADIPDIKVSVFSREPISTPKPIK